MKKIVYSSLEGRKASLAVTSIGQVVDTLTKGEAGTILCKLIHGTLVSCLFLVIPNLTSFSMVDCNQEF